MAGFFFSCEVNPLDLSAFLCKAPGSSEIRSDSEKKWGCPVLGRSSFIIEFALLQVILILKNIECSSN